LCRRNIRGREVNRAPTPVDVNPVLTAPRNYLFHVYRGGLFYMAPVNGEAPPILVLELLHRIADTFQVYFGPEDATESKLRKNFAICFQLLEEVRLFFFFIFVYLYLLHV
jgi:AP-3 complex subunit mu